MLRKNIAFLICCVCLVCGEIETDAAVGQMKSDEYADTELIVLVDTSASITGEKKKNEVLWAQEIYAFSDILEINTAYVYFDDPEEEYDIACSTSGDTSECLNGLDTMTYDGQMTELAGPMKYAVSFMEESQAKNKYIMILSDGDEDLVGRNGRSLTEIPYSKEEKNCIKEFKKLVSDFNRKENQEVVLVGLEKDVCLFKKLKAEQGIEYFSGAKGIRESLAYIFKKLGYPFEETMAMEEDGRLIIKLKDDLYGVILEIQWDGKLEDAEDMLHITHGSKETEVSEKFLAGESTMFVHIFEPDGGDYQIDMPVENLRCTGFQQEKLALGSIKFNISKDLETVNPEIIENGDTKVTKYVVEGEDVEFLLEPEAERGDLKEWYPVVAYYLRPYKSGEDIEKYPHEGNEWKNTQVHKEKDGKNTRRFKITNIPYGCYLCTVRTITNGRTDFSNTVLFETIPIKCDIDKKMKITGKEGETFNLKDYLCGGETEKSRFTILRYGDDNTTDFYFEGKIDTESVQFEEGKLIFLEEGTYIMEVMEEKMEKRIVEFEIKRDKKWWEKIWEAIWF